MPETKRPLKVFLSYASQDASVVHELSQRLASEGWIEPWVDKKKLLPGQDWRSKIEEAVETSDNVIICLSANSVGKDGFVQKELRYAREIAFEKPEETIFIIPLRLDDCSVPRGLRFYQWGDYFGDEKEETYIALLEALKLRHEQKLKLAEEEYIRQEQEKIKRIEQEKEKRAAAEKLAKEKAEREAAEKAAREKVLKEIAEKERQEKERQRLARREFVNSFLVKTTPFLKYAGIIVLIAIALWGGSLATPRFIALFPTATPTFTSAPTLIPPTITITPTATKIVKTNLITFVSDRGECAAGTSITNENCDKTYLYTINYDGSNKKSLTMGTASLPSWSPSGDKIVFSSNKDGDWEICTVNFDGTNETQITHNNLAEDFPTWSPDGSQIVFSKVINGSWDIFLMNSDGSNVRSVTNTKDVTETYPQWSPDGETIAFHSRKHDSNDWNIFLINVDGSNRRQLTDSVLNWMPVWSPDGKYIAFWSVRDSSYSWWEIYTMNADGTNQQQITNHVSPSSEGRNPVTWSPDGTQIAFDAKSEGGNGIYIFNFIDRSIDEFLSDKGIFYGQPSWLK